MILLESEGSDAGCHCEADRQRRSLGAETMDGTDMRPQLLAPDSGHYEAASDRSGERAAVMLTLIQTAKLNDVDPQAWLADVLARIADHKVTDPAALLPWNWRRTIPVAHAA